MGEHVQCCVAGCGPAGAVLGLLLARADIHVLVLEKHADFLRDFRGDTIHPSTQELVDELGLGEAFAQLPLNRAETLSVVTDDGEFQLADFRRTPGGRPLVFLPQWDFLDFLVDEARRLPTFALRTQAEVVDVARTGSRVRGVRYVDAHGTTQHVTADLVVAADGRDSRVRRAVGMRPVGYGAPMDVLWFRLPRRDTDPDNPLGRFSTGVLLVMIDRASYWQVGFLIPKGGYGRVRAAGLADFRRRIESLAPFLDGRTASITSWDDVKLLSVQVNRLRRWWRPGLLCIGDAAHAMSPVGGVGINLAIQDAVATANLVAEPLRTGTLRPWHLARVQARRMLPTVVTQTIQRIIQRRFLARLLAGRTGGTPAVLRVINRFPVLQALPAFAIGRGVLPEHPRGRGRRPPVMSTTVVDDGTAREHH